MLGKNGLLVALLPVLVVALASPDASARRRGMHFGQSDEMVCLVDMPSVGPEGEELCLAAHNAYYALIGGLYSTSELVIAAKSADVYDAYYPLPTGNDLSSLQASGVLPDPLPTYDRPISDYISGYSLWFMILVMVAAYFAIGRAGRRRATRDDPQVLMGTMLRVLIAAMLADGTIHEHEKETIRLIYRKTTGLDLNESDFKRMILEIAHDKTDIEVQMQKVRSRITPDSKGLVVRDALMILCADGHVADAEKTFLTKVARGLALSEKQFEAVIAGASPGARGSVRA